MSAFGLGGKTERRVEGVIQGVYGVPDLMTAGFASQKGNLGPVHPLEVSEKNFQQTQLRMELNMLRNTQGLHAPMKIAMELKAAQKVGRLPFLPSSNLMVDVLQRRDEQISFEDFLNPSEFREHMGQPHAVVEKSLGIL